VIQGDNDPEPYHQLFDLFSGIIFQGFSFEIIVLFLFLGLLLLLSALVSGAEVAFFSLNPADLHDLRTNINRVNNRFQSLYFQQ